MSSWQRLCRVELPIAVPLIMAGVRVATVINIGIAAIAAYIGAGGLGSLIIRGIAQSDSRQLLAGAILISVIAIAADYALYALQRVLTPKGLSMKAAGELKEATT
ncbi:Osmoprotectant import permease protein OsmW [compost metagenome]